jgi:hypothetical protein
MYASDIKALTYSATILARQKTPDDGRIQPKHVVRKKGDWTSCISEENIVAYFFQARTVEAEKQPLLGNARTKHLSRCQDTPRVQPLLCSAGSIRMRGDVTQQQKRCSLWVTQRLYDLTDRVQFRE